MANVEIVTAGPGEVGLLTTLYNEVFRPPRDASFFQRRFLGRYNLVILIARLDDRPVGFAAGFELKPSTYYAWLCGVLPDFRNLGIASQLLHALQGWAAEHQYEFMRMECHNRHREIIRVAIDLEFDVAGVRWDSERQDNLIIFERALSEHA